MDRIKQLKKFLEEEPQDVFLIYTLGLEYISIDEFEKARLQFDKVIETNSEYLAVYYQYAKLFERLEDLKNAEKMYRTGIDIAKKQKNDFTLRELNSALEELLYE